MDFSLFIRFLIGGCVAINSDINERGLVGDAINIDAIDWVLSICSMRESVLIFCSADANAWGLRVINAPVASAAYSRLREIAI